MKGFLIGLMFGWDRLACMFLKRTNIMGFFLLCVLLEKKDINFKCWNSKSFRGIENKLRGVIKDV